MSQLSSAIIYTIFDDFLPRFAAERTDTYIKVWFWDRNDPSVPGDIRNGAGQANPDAWVCRLYSNWETLVDFCACARVFRQRTSLTRLAKSPNFSLRIISLSTLRFVRPVNYPGHETNDKGNQRWCMGWCCVRSIGMSWIVYR